MGNRNAPLGAAVLRFRPSLTDVLFASLLAWLFAAGGGWTNLLADGDTGWHIRTGEHILAAGSPPRTDLFSFSRPGEPWFAWEWLSDVLFALLHRWWGLAGVAALAGFTIAGALLLLFRQMLWRGANVLISLAVLFLGASASSIHYLARPHIFSLLLLAASLWIVERDRRRPDQLVWALAPVTALWANLHGGFLALVATLTFLAAGYALEAWLLTDPARWAPARRYSAIGAACAAASLLNPYGFQLHLHIARYLRSEWILEAVDEFQSPKFRSENLLHFEALLLAGLLLAGALVAKGRFAGALPVLAWAHFSLVSVRHVPVFVVASAPLIASELSRIWASRTERASGKSLTGILNAVARDLSPGFRRNTAWAAVLGMSVLWATPSSKWPRDFPGVKFPASIVRSHGETLTHARVFTSDQWADYLIYRGWPAQKVFVDGRSDFYGPSIGKDYLALVEGRPNWEKLLKKYDFDAVLIPRHWPLAQLLAGREGWRRAAGDRQAVLFLRRPCQTRGPNGTGLGFR